MREALILQLEKLSYYQHLSLVGGLERPIFAYRIVDIRGARFHVLSRIQDAGLDFTGRTNFIAHHLVIAPEELRRFPIPPIILRDWSGWVKLWTKEPQLLESEDWIELTTLTCKTNVPAQTWQRITGDAVNCYGLLEVRTGASFRVDDEGDEIVLALFAESLEVLEVRDTRRDYRAAAWNYTFTTSMQEQDNPADFRWRCIHSDNPAASRFATPDCKELSAVRATKWTDEETAFARSGRQAPRFVTEPQDARIAEGGSARFTAKAEGVPKPSYQWFSVDRANTGQVLPGETNSELVVSNPALGISRYVVNATNTSGHAQSQVATLSVDPKLRLAPTRLNTGSPEPANVGTSYVKSGEDIERQRKRLQAEMAQKRFQNRPRQNKILLTISAIVLIAVAGVLAWKKIASAKSPETLPAQLIAEKSSDKDSPLPQLSSVTPPALSTNLPISNSNRSDSPQLPNAAEFPLPDGWAKLDIGNVSNAHTDYITNASTQPRFDLSVAATGFLTNGDVVLFVCKTNTGKEFKATLLKIDSDSASRRSGIMLRESDKAGAPFLFIGASPEKVVSCRRNNKGELAPEEAAEIGRGRTIFLKFDRKKDNQFVPAYSQDDEHWTPFEAYEFSTNTQVLVGFAISSGNLSNRVEVSFLDISSKNDSAMKK